jgi:branched-chain amino acid transport system permease protein
MLDLIPPVLVNGCAIALVALGFHLVIRSTGGIVDFAIGQYAIIAGLAAALISSELHLPTLFVVALGCLASIVVALLDEVAVIRPAILLNRDPLAMAPVLATVSLLMVWEQVARLVFGDFPLRGPSFLSGVRYSIGEIPIPAHSVVIVVTTVLVFLAVQLWLDRTKAGRMLRAIGDNRLAAQLLGFSVNRSRALAFMLAGATVGIAGGLISPLAGFGALGGGYYTLNGFVALFIGGVASPAGAFLGGIVLEAIKIAVGRYLGSGYQDYLVLALSLLVFAFRPQGILGKRKTRSA